MAVYSHSKLATYENCPQKYKLQYIDHVKLPDGGEGIEAFLGSRVHEVLEKLHKELIISKLNSLEGLLAYYRDQWKKNWHDNIVIVRKGFTPTHYLNTGKDAIENYYKRHQPFNGDKTLATEQRLMFKIGNYTVVGYVDRLSCHGKGNYEIHDYKTSASLPSQAEKDEDRQLALYQIGIKERFIDAKDICLIWHYLVFDKEIISRRTDTQLKDLKKAIISLIKTIEKDTKFLPVESKLCDWCDYPEYCPAKKHEMKVRDLMLNKYLKEKGVSLVNKYASLKSQIRTLRDQEAALQLELDLVADAAASYAKEEGLTNITGSDYILRVTEETVFNFPRSGEERREELEKYIKKAGIWEDVSGLNLARLNKVIYNDELDKKTRNGLLKLAKETDEVRVRLVKKESEETEP